jgi:branched-chain amino acid aminotransferase
LDGAFVESKTARVPLLTHSLHYGSAVFEGERFYATSNGPAIFRLEDHTKRLFHSAKVMGMDIPFSRTQIIKATKELIIKNKLADGYIRPIIFYGEKMGLAPKGCPVRVAIAAWPWGAYLGESPVRTSIVKIRRHDSRTVDPTAKVSGYYANSILATLEAKRAGADEAILLDTNGCVAEGPGENIFIVKNNVLLTPALGSILPGITRDSIIKIAHDKKIKVLEKKLLPKELHNADEVFFTGTAAEITAIGFVDSKKIGNGAVGPITKMLKESYMSIVHGTTTKYHKWLTFSKD